MPPPAIPAIRRRPAAILLLMLALWCALLYGGANPKPQQPPREWRIRLVYSPEIGGFIPVACPITEIIK